LILEVGLNKILKDAIKHWELEDKPEVSEYYDDFPKLGLERKVCMKCKPRIVK